MMAAEGSKRIEVAGLGDKHQLTVVFSATLTGDFLPPQVIYAGKTQRCLSSTKFPDDWNVTFTPNHWANEETTELHILTVLVPYFQQCRKKLSLSDDHAALVIFDRFKGQCTPRIMSLLEENHIHFVIMPANCTDRLQPLDISVNKAVKENLRKQFQERYSTQVCKQIDGVTNQPVDLKMSVVKLQGAKWLMNTFKYIKANPSIIVMTIRRDRLRYRFVGNMQIFYYEN